MVSRVFVCGYQYRHLCLWCGEFLCVWLSVGSVCGMESICVWLSVVPVVWRVSVCLVISIPASVACRFVCVWLSAYYY